MSELGQLVDHAAELQRQVDRLWTELLLIWVMLFALAVAVTVQAWQSWQASS
jgi:hypothetical protein